MLERALQRWLHLHRVKLGDGEFEMGECLRALCGIRGLQGHGMPCPYGIEVRLLRRRHRRLQTWRAGGRARLRGAGCGQTALRRGTQGEGSLIFWINVRAWSARSRTAALSFLEAASSASSRRRSIWRWTRSLVRLRRMHLTSRAGAGTIKRAPTAGGAIHYL